MSFLIANLIGDSPPVQKKCKLVDDAAATGRESLSNTTTEPESADISGEAQSKLWTQLTRSSKSDHFPPEPPPISRTVSPERSSVASFQDYTAMLIQQSCFYGMDRSFIHPAQLPASLDIYKSIPPTSEPTLYHRSTEATTSSLSSIATNPWPYYYTPSSHFPFTLSQSASLPTPSPFLSNFFYPPHHQQHMYGNILAHPFYASKRKGGQVRFTTSQTESLEKRFRTHKYLSPEDRRVLAESLKLSDRQVKTWFQNRRAKWRRSNDLPDKHSGDRLEYTTSSSASDSDADEDTKETDSTTDKGRRNSALPDNMFRN